MLKRFATRLGLTLLASLALVLIFTHTAFAEAFASYVDPTGASVVLTDDPCPLTVLRHVEQGNRGHFRRASVLTAGGLSVACAASWQWKGDPTIYIRVMDEDGDSVYVPVKQFRLNKGGE